MSSLHVPVKPTSIGAFAGSPHDIASAVPASESQDATRKFTVKRYTASRRCVVRGRALVPFHHAILLFCAALVGGTLNSVAGGGGFIVFPSLLFTGMNAINANATNTVALWPGTLASTGAYRRELADRRVWKLLGPLFVVTFVGSIVGALLLLHTPEKTFVRLVPFLLGGATCLFTFGGRLSAFVRGRLQRHSERNASLLTVVAVTLLQLMVSVYIGYFGAGSGILMLALFAIMGMENIHTMNAFKSLLATCANGVAVITFVIAGKIVWPQALVMVVGAGIGGYGGAWYAQKLDPKRVRWVIIVVGCTMTTYFALKHA